MQLSYDYGHVGEEMTERAFVIMQVGAKGSTERKRADEIFNFVVAPTVGNVGLEPYRADLDFTPGPITPRFLSELLKARLIIADLTGRNPNVYYELGIAHSFARPLISIADSSKTLPFDAKDERVIELGEYSPSGLTYAQGEQAKADLQESLKIVLADGYVSPSPLREVAASASLDRLAPENPIAAEMTQIRESLDEIRKMVSPSHRPVLLPFRSGWTGSSAPSLIDYSNLRFASRETEFLLSQLQEIAANDPAARTRLVWLLAELERSLAKESVDDKEASSTGETGSGEVTPT